MMKSEDISTIKGYIENCPIEHQDKLQALYKFIRNKAPKETTELISYKMPTFRYNGNLIHFALFKNHIGIYPGTEALTQFKEEIKEYKSTKGALQIPLHDNIPWEIIEKFIAYNVDTLKDKKGPNWTQYQDLWVEADELMQSIMLEFPLTKTHKWGADIYTYQNKNLIGWGGFKHFFSIWFYNGVFLKDENKYLISASEGKTKSLRQWRFDTVDALKNQLKTVQAYIRESILTIDKGQYLTIEKGKTLTLEGPLLEALQDDELLEKSFEMLTQSKRNEYIEYINEAKQLKTQLSRIEKIKPLILEKKGLHDKYKKQ